MSRLMEKPVLVLNATYEPIQFASTRRALVLVYKGVAVTELDRGREVRKGMVAPSVIRLREYRKVPHQKVQPNPRNILMRDNHRCQYCGDKFSKDRLTLDHVTPRAQGGLSTWENLVACCEPCNRRKADRTPEQADMPLLSRPWKMNIHTCRGMMRKMGEIEPDWKQYLYY